MLAIRLILTIFVLSSSSGAVMPESPGNFHFCPYDMRCYQCREFPKGLQSPVEGLDTAKGDTVFCYHCLNIQRNG